MLTELIADMDSFVTVFGSTSKSREKATYTDWMDSNDCAFLVSLVAFLKAIDSYDQEKKRKATDNNGDPQQWLTIYQEGRSPYAS